MSEAIGELVDRADPPLYVVTTAAAGERAGCVVGFATQASIDPPRFLVAISKANRTWQRRPRPRATSRCICSGASGLMSSTCSAARPVTRSTSSNSAIGPRATAGVPLLDGAAAWFVGRVIERFDFGDHVGHLLQPVRGGTATTSPDAVTLHDADDLSPGHPA